MEAEKRNGENASVVRRRWLWVCCCAGIVALSGCAKSRESGLVETRPAQTSVAASTAASPSANASDPASKGLLSADGSYFVVYATNPWPIPLNEPFGISVQVFDAHDRTLRLSDIALDVDGRMPHHRHGMNVQPRVTAHGDGTFLVQGMLFHMPGRWELYFDVTRSGITERAQDVVMLE